MKKLILFSAIGLLFLNGCKKDNPPMQAVTTLDLNFKATYGDETFVTYKEFNYPDGRKIQFNNFNFFVSDIALMSEDAGGNLQETELEDIAFLELNYTESQLSEAIAGETLNLVDIPTGDYTGIKIGFGVKADLNRSKPAEYGAGHPLTKNYWDGWSSYIFSQLEGAADMDNNGEIVIGGSDTESFTYHSGTDEVYVDFTFNQAITLSNDTDDKITISVDVKDLLKNSSPEWDTNADGYLDIQTFRGTHSAGAEIAIARAIMSNFVTATTIE